MKLDANFQPKLGDFGLSKLVSTRGHVTAAASGSFAHMATEMIIATGTHIDPLLADVYRYIVFLFIHLLFCWF